MKDSKPLNYKGKGEHSVNELELIINQQAEELHLFNSGQKQLNLSGVVFSEAELKVKLEEQLEETKQWLIEEVFEGLAERL